MGVSRFLRKVGVGCGYVYKDFASAFFISGSTVKNAVKHYAASVCDCSERVSANCAIVWPK